MQDILEPLQRMGAGFEGGTTLPLVFYGRRPLRAIKHTVAPPSAQVKSAILLAALGATGKTTVVESQPTRDHTEVFVAAVWSRNSQGQKSAGRNAHKTSRTDGNSFGGSVFRGLSVGSSFAGAQL